jgi:hypothetical protein
MRACRTGSRGARWYHDEQVAISVVVGYIDRKGRRMSEGSGDELLEPHFGLGDELLDPFEQPPADYDGLLTPTFEDAPPASDDLMTPDFLQDYGDDLLSPDFE